MSFQAVVTQKIISVDPRYLRAKRVLDISFLVAVSLLIIPICLILAILIRLDSHGPILYRQKRVGLHGEEFEMLKFRSMYNQCDDTIHRTAVEKFMNGDVLNGIPHTPYKLHDDPRLTRVGRFLRKTSLDELPQFWNVLRGEMTLVGPRPPLPYEVELYSPHDWLRLLGKPGLTGLWQVYGRNQVTFEQMIQMDITYLQQQSIWKDLKLIAKTVPVMIQGQGQ